MWGREMRAGLLFVLVSLLAGSAFREWRRAHEGRFSDLIARLEQEARIPGESKASAAPTPREPGPAPRSAPRLAPARVDIDRASAAELERLPGIGPALAARIVADRTSRGPFQDPEALLRVKGIGPRILGRIRPFLSPAPPADSATSSAN